MNQILIRDLSGVIYTEDYERTKESKSFVIDQGPWSSWLVEFELRLCAKQCVQTSRG